MQTAETIDENNRNVLQRNVLIIDRDNGRRLLLFNINSRYDNKNNKSFRDILLFVCFEERSNSLYQLYQD